MSDTTAVPFGFPAICRKKITAAFDSGRLTSDGGVLLLAQIEQRLGWLIDWPSASKTHAIRRRCSTPSPRWSATALLIAAGYLDGNNCDALRADPVKMAVGRLLPGPAKLMRMKAAMIELFCDSFDQVPSRIVLDIDAGFCPSTS